jgi:hypothetical protein
MASIDPEFSPAIPVSTAMRLAKVVRNQGERADSHRGVVDGAQRSAAGRLCTPARVPAQPLSLYVPLTKGTQTVSCAASIRRLRGHDHRLQRRDRQAPLARRIRCQRLLTLGFGEGQRNAIHHDGRRIPTVSLLLDAPYP